MRPPGGHPDERRVVVDHMMLQRAAHVKDQHELAHLASVKGDAQRGRGAGAAGELGGEEHGTDPAKFTFRRNAWATSPRATMRFTGGEVASSRAGGQRRPG